MLAFSPLLKQEIAAGKRITLLGFGTFKLSHRAARKGRNPQTGEEIQIKASNSPSFSASKSFKERCN
jgi:DNA-binding protein HU-beta